ncbi:hypothetical protein ACT9ST_24415 (plasmid) [Sphingobium limneticum]|jgi:hypothetical protein|uniref:hypothetical protein n=1 Tax=Alphaproteobacteria TaxID=28211 RepID=UPI000F76DADB|nr:hypothetical protein [Nitrobacter sp.]QEH80895.1 hypothetical protein EIK56_23350 [Sphingomonas sp. C8-2]
MDNATFESAVVEAVVDGHELRIDFLTNGANVRMAARMIASSEEAEGVASAIRGPVISGCDP